MNEKIKYPSAKSCLITLSSPLSGNLRFGLIRRRVIKLRIFFAKNQSCHNCNNYNNNYSSYYFTHFITHTLSKILIE